jgi:hypothetical protein
MRLPDNKTKIVATIGPASETPEMLERLIHAGLNVARLNFSHGDLREHAERIRRIRSAAKTVGRRVAIMADLPGPKMHIGKIEPEPLQLHPGENFVLTTEEIAGTPQRVSVSFKRLPKVVKPGDRLFLNDGLVQLTVERISGSEVHTKVLVPGELHSKKGLNLPGIRLGISAFTDHDRACLEFALQQGVDAVSQSFVETCDDIEVLATDQCPSLATPYQDGGGMARIDEGPATSALEQLRTAGLARSETSWLVTRNGTRKESTPHGRNRPGSIQPSPDAKVRACSARRPRNLPFRYQQGGQLVCRRGRWGNPCGGDEARCRLHHHL